MKHTPTPWVFKERRHDLIAIGSLDSSFACCVVNGPEPSNFADGDGIERAQRQRANATFIVRACNAHDELIAALKLAHSFLRKSEMAAKLAARMPSPPEQAREFLEVQGRISDAVANAEEAA